LKCHQERVVFLGGFKRFFKVATIRIAQAQNIVRVEIGWIRCYGSFGPGDMSSIIQDFVFALCSCQSDLGKQEALISSDFSGCGKEGIGKEGIFDYHSDRIHHFVNDSMPA
jgi:hypothetical protein